MLEALARNWGWLLFRVALSISYGIVAFAWPNLNMVSFVYLFGLYAIIDGMVALAIAIDVKALRGFGSLLFESLVRIFGGLIAMGQPDILLTFPRYFAAWSILTGIAEIVVAIVLRRELSYEWPLPFAGIISITVALLILFSPAEIGVPALRWLVGPYAMFFGVTLLALVRRLRQLAQEIEAAS
jgi:uncharacterized membrane protein HdeD (DUF308 family)